MVHSLFSSTIGSKLFHVTNYYCTAYILITEYLSIIWIYQPLCVSFTLLGKCLGNSIITTYYTIDV